MLIYIFLWGTFEKWGIFENSTLNYKSPSTHLTCILGEPGGSVVEPSSNNRLYGKLLKNGELSKIILKLSSNTHFTCILGERGGSVVERLTLEREVGGSKPTRTSAVLCP